MNAVFIFQGERLPLIRYAIKIERNIQVDGRPTGRMRFNPVELYFANFHPSLKDFLSQEDYYEGNCEIRLSDDDGNQIGEYRLENVFLIGYEELWNEQDAQPCALQVRLTCEKMEWNGDNHFELEERWPQT